MMLSLGFFSGREGWEFKFPLHAFQFKISVIENLDLSVSFKQEHVLTDLNLNVF